MTSREIFPDLAIVPGSGIRTFQLGGLEIDDSRTVLADKGLLGSPEEWRDLVARLSGNGLALKAVLEAIRELFGGDVGAFNRQREAGGHTVFAGIGRMFRKQIGRLSQFEQRVLPALAVCREPMSALELIAALGSRSLPGTVLESLDALRRRSLVERADVAGGAVFTLQSLVLEF